MEVHKSSGGTQRTFSRESQSERSLRNWELLSRSFDTSFDRLTSFGNINFEKEVHSKCLVNLKKIVDRSPIVLHLWNEILAMMCVIATSLDPLFCYILLVDEGKRCVTFDNKLRTIAVILRSITDFIYIILMVFHFQFGYSSLYNATRNRADHGICTRAWKFLLSYFTVDVLAVLPLPQVVVLFVIPRVKGCGFIYAVRSLKYILLVQYLPRIFRIYAFLKKVRWTANILPETAGAKAAFNLFLYMLASHVIGAFWYLFTVERKTTCWLGHCQHCPVNCNYALGNVSADSLCSPEGDNGQKTFDFGIFKDALHIVGSRDFVKKISVCYWWGLQKLSSLGQDLKTSEHLWEIYFAITITISGLILFALLVGNLQTYLQSTIARLEEMRLKGQDIELWMPYHSLPLDLKEKIKRYERFKWRETKGVDVEQLLHNLPRDLRRHTKRHLCSTPLSKVSKLRNLDEKLLNAICEYLKPRLYIEHSYIVQEGEPLDEIVFIIQGKVMIYSKSDGKSAEGSLKFCNWLKNGDFYGDDLLDWALQNPSPALVPVSTKTLRVYSKVEAFVLKANDLKTVVKNNWWLLRKNLPGTNLPGTAPIWELWAALAVQLAWRRYYKSRRKRERKTSLEFATEGKNPPGEIIDAPAAVSVLSCGYVVRALHALKKKMKKTQPQTSKV